MDLVSTAFSIVGKGIAVAKFIWKVIESIKELEKQRSELQMQLSALLSILRNMKKSDTLQDYLFHGEVHTAVKNLDPILNETAEMCVKLDLEQAAEALLEFHGEDKSFFRKIIDKVKEAKEALEIALLAENKAVLLEQLDKRLKLALSILQVAFSYTHVKDLKELAVELTLVDNAFDVYTNPSGDPPRNKLESIKAYVDKQRLIVKWADPEGSGAVRRYEVSYSEAKHLHISSAETSVAIGLQRIKPWQNYAIQVRVVTDAGASPWSDPPIYVRMNEGPPSRPILVAVDATDRQSLKVSAEKPPVEQGVTTVYVEKRLKTEINWQRVKYDKVNAEGYVLRKLDRTKEYMIRIRYQNKFGISVPSGEIPVVISEMFLGIPTDFKISRLTKTSVSFVQANFGAASKYQVQVGGNGARWQDIEQSQVENNKGTISFSLDATIEEIKAGDMRLQATTMNGSVMEINAPVSVVETIKHEETVMRPGILEFGLDHAPSTNRSRRNVSLFEATQHRPLLTFETIELSEPKKLTFETIEVTELSVSTKFNRSTF